MNVKTTDKCRISGEPLIELFSLKEIYITDFLKPEETVNPTEKIKLTLCLAPKSGLVQLKETTPSDLMYRRYWYRTGTNQTMQNEMLDIVYLAEKLMKLKSNDVFVDIGCNDGTLLSYVDSSIKTVGFDPAKNGYKEVAEEKMDYFINDYFSAKTYPLITLAKVVTSIAMFYDLDNPHEFIEDIKKIMHKDGIWIVQMNYLPLMLNFLALDNISHEHLGYYSLTALKNLLDLHDMKLLDVTLDELNGGVFRAVVVNNNCNTTKIGTQPYRDVAQMRVDSLLAYETTLKLDEAETYHTFYAKSVQLKEDVMKFIKTEKAKGKSIWCYGASSRGNTMLQFFELDTTLITAAAERASTKFGLRTVGTNIPIVSEEDMRKAQPDYLLVLPYAFISEFKEREHEYLAKGGKFIVPCPKFEIIGA